MGWTSSRVKTTSFPLSLPACSLNLPCLKSSHQSLEVELKSPSSVQFPWNMLLKLWVLGSEQCLADLTIPCCRKMFQPRWPNAWKPPLLRWAWAEVLFRQFARRMLVMNEASIKSHNCLPKLLLSLFWKDVKFYNTMQSFEKCCEWGMSVLYLEQMKRPVVYQSVTPVAYILHLMKQFLIFASNTNGLCALCV